MSTTDLCSAPAGRRAWLTATDCHLDEFAAIVGATTNLTAYPADSVTRNVLVYDCDRLRNRITTADGRWRKGRCVTRRSAPIPPLPPRARRAFHTTQHSES